MKILHEDQHLLVVDKPAGLPVLPDGWEKDAPYLVKMLEEKHGKLWIVHRLDKSTSGVIVFARDPETHGALNLQFEIHQIEKVYHAIVEGNPKWEEKTARHPLRANVGHKHRTMVDNKNGKPSETHFRVLKRGQAAALVEAKPVTGRTHQVRVHAYTLGHPLLGDLLYSAEETEIIQRPALHAHSLILTLNEERMTFKAPYPNDFRAALESLKQRI
ncbi:MAG TPA: RluA family pseudouridine synthase [Anaerolineales bacterium]|nr:RluA family pseudouridine synthase [Anaerolineales bacterium]